MLTQDSNATPTKNSPRGHAKSKSMSAANLESPGPGPGSSHARVHLPNSFTAKNLALPTTPSPLPMHPSQFSNTSTRRGRRITIDHDMDLLTGT
jgi:centromeric protein E